MNVNDLYNQPFFTISFKDQYTASFEQIEDVQWNISEKSNQNPFKMQIINNEENIIEQVQNFEYKTTIYNLTLQVVQQEQNHMFFHIIKYKNQQISFEYRFDSNYNKSNKIVIGNQKYLSQVKQNNLDPKNIFEEKIDVQLDSSNNVNSYCEIDFSNFSSYQYQYLNKSFLIFLKYLVLKKRENFQTDIKFFFSKYITQKIYSFMKEAKAFTFQDFSSPPTLVFRIAKLFFVQFKVSSIQEQHLVSDLNNRISQNYLNICKQNDVFHITFRTLKFIILSPCKTFSEYLLIFLKEKLNSQNRQIQQIVKRFFESKIMIKQRNQNWQENVLIAYFFWIIFNNKKNISFPGIPDYIENQLKSYLKINLQILLSFKFDQIHQFYEVHTIFQILQKQSQTFLSCPVMEIEVQYKNQNIPAVLLYLHQIITFGRQQNAGIYINDNQVSRYHGCFFFENDQWLISDGVLVDDQVIISQNGIWKELRKKEAYFLNSGQQFYIGDYLIQFTEKRDKDQKLNSTRKTRQCRENFLKQLMNHAKNQ